MPAKIAIEAEGQVLTVKHARINATADGNNTVIAAVAAHKLLVLGFAFTVTAAGTVTFQDGVPTVYASFPLAANGGISYAGSLEAPAFEVATGQPLVVNNPATVDTLGFVTYVELP